MITPGFFVGLCNESEELCHASEVCSCTLYSSQFKFFASTTSDPSAHSQRSCPYFFGMNKKPLKERSLASNAARHRDLVTRLAANEEGLAFVKARCVLRNEVVELFEVLMIQQFCSIGINAFLGSFEKSVPISYCRRPWN
jgi:hypothetical protein